MACRGHLAGTAYHAAGQARPCIPGGLAGLALGAWFAVITGAKVVRQLVNYHCTPDDRVRAVEGNLHVR